MKRILYLSVVALVGWAGAAQAGHHCGPNCKDIPPEDCPDCSPPCQGHHHCSAWKSAHAHKLLEDLCAEECCVRIKAAKKLGHRLHADFCCDCEIVPGLLQALLSDPCWEVRRAAAWSLAMQGARTEQALAGLYVASRLDRHYLVRARALEAIDILTLCRGKCYTELFKATDALVKQLQKDKIRTGTKEGSVILSSLPAAVSTHSAVEVINPPVSQEPDRERVLYSTQSR
jgi:hypothetical protein